MISLSLSSQPTHIIYSGHKIVLVGSHVQLRQDVLIGAFIHDACVGSLSIVSVVRYTAIATYILVVHVLQQEHDAAQRHQMPIDLPHQLPLLLLTE
jgi:hypothetical protein